MDVVFYFASLDYFWMLVLYFASSAMFMIGKSTKQICFSYDKLLVLPVSLAKTSADITTINYSVQCLVTHVQILDSCR